MESFLNCRGCVLLAGASMVGLAVVGSPAAAQDAPPPSQASGASASEGVLKPTPSSGALQDIIVTARRREESLQKVPVAVTAITPLELARKSINRAEDLGRNVPSLTVQPALAGRQSANFFIRGQGATYGGALPSVITYFSDVPLDPNGGGSFALNDLQSVQVLRGPQGTLFGRNANGGAVVLTPQAPGSEMTGNFDVSTGNYRFVEAKGALTIPITPTLGIRISGDYAHRHGFTKNLSGPDYDNLDNKSWRAFIRWKPVPWFRDDFIYNGLAGSGNGDGFELVSVRPGSIATGYPIPGFPLSEGTGLLNDLAAQQKYGPRKINAPLPYNGSHRNVQLFANTATFTIGDVTLKNITAYERVRACSSTQIFVIPTNFSVSTCDPNIYTSGEGLTIHPNENIRQFSTETQVSGNFFDNKLQAVAGFFYLHSRTPQPLAAFTPIDVFKVTIVGNIASATTDDTSKAVYAQGTYALTNKLHLTAGVRYTWDDRGLSFGEIVSFDNGAAGTFRCEAPGKTGAPVADCFNIYKGKWGNFGYTASLDWQKSDNLLLYVTSRRGYKSGGANNLSLSATPFYGQEILTDAEIGAKLRYDAGFAKGTFNIDYYHGWYKGTQLQETLLVNGSATAVIENAKGSHLDGLEAEFNMTFFDHLDLSGFYSYTSAHFNKGAFIDGGVDSSSSAFQGVSKNIFSATVAYRISLDGADGMVLTPSITYYTRGKSAFAANTILNPGAFAPGYQIGNARLELSHIGGSSLSIAGFVNNFTDRAYVESGLGLENSVGTTSFLYGEPRTYGAELAYHF